MIVLAEMYVLFFLVGNVELIVAIIFAVILLAFTIVNFLVATSTEILSEGITSPTAYGEVPAVVTAT